MISAPIGEGSRGSRFCGPLWRTESRGRGREGPWLPIHVAGLWALVRGWRRWDEPRLFLAITLACIVLVVSLSASKVAAYYLPVAFLLPLITRGLLAEVLTPADVAAAWPWWTVHANLGLVVSGVVADPLVAGIWLGDNALPWLALPGLAAGSGSASGSVARRLRP